MGRAVVERDIRQLHQLFSAAMRGRDGGGVFGARNRNDRDTPLLHLEGHFYGCGVAAGIGYDDSGVLRPDFVGCQDLGGKAFLFFHCGAVQSAPAQKHALVEYRVDGVNQIQVKPEIGLDFASVLRSLLRHDPDIIMIGEIRDRDTAEIAVQAALTGHMVLSTLHTNSAASSIARLLDMGVESYLIASALTGVLAQRLCRRVCSHCAEPYTVTRSHLSDFPEAIEPEYTLHRGKGCEHCDGTGFYGRVGLYELMVANDEMRELVQKSPEAGPIRELARRNGTKLLRECGWQAIAAGTSTVEEIRRVTQWT